MIRRISPSASRGKALAACYNNNIPIADGRLRVTFAAPQRAVTPGQALVCYDGDNVTEPSSVAARCRYSITCAITHFK